MSAGHGTIVAHGLDRRGLLRLLVGIGFGAAFGGCGRRPRSASDDPFVHAFRIVRPSVALLTLRVPSGDPKKRGELEDAFGTGIVIASGAWGSQLLTLEHVVHDARSLRVTLGERRAIPAQVIASDAKVDLALIETSAADLTVVPLGSSAQLEPGTTIGIVGFPIPDAFEEEGLGVGPSVFSGRIAGLRKGALELDIPVIPGESGGPVFDGETGAVIGLAESRFEEERAIGFAIPIDDAKRFLSRTKVARYVPAR